MLMLIRPFIPDDAAALSRLIIQNVREVNSRDYSPEAIAALLPHFTPEDIINHAAKWLTLVCTIDQSVVGTASLDGDRVRDVFVAVDHHRAGIGRELMRAIESAAIKRNRGRLFLLAGLSAEDFYRKLKWVVVKRFSNDLNGIPLPVIRMEKQLAPQK